MKHHTPRVQRYPRWMAHRPGEERQPDNAMRDAAWVAWSVAALLAIVLLSGKPL